MPMLASPVALSFSLEKAQEKVEAPRVIKEPQAAKKMAPSCRKQESAVQRRLVPNAAPASIAPTQASAATPFFSPQHIPDLGSRIVLDAAPPAFAPLSARAATFPNQHHGIARGHSLVLRERHGAGASRHVGC